MFSCSQISLWLSAVAFYVEASRTSSLLSSRSKVVHSKVPFTVIETLSLVSGMVAALLALLSNLRLRTLPNPVMHDDYEMIPFGFSSMLNWLKYIILPICFTLIAAYSRNAFRTIDINIGDLRNNMYDYKKA